MFTGQDDACDKSIMLAEESKLPENVDSMYLNEKFSDVTFLVAGEKIPAHKAILALKSRCFERFFDANADKKEITISNTSPTAFRVFLKYIYTDTITRTSDIELISQVLVLACQYSFTHLASQMVGKIDTILDVTNVIVFINEANNHDLDELRDACHSFIDQNALQTLSSSSFDDLTQKSLTQILKRNSFSAPEIEIFKSVAKWSETNNNNIVLDCVRLSLLTVPEIVSIVWPTKLVGSKKLLETISVIVGDGSKHLHRMAVKTPDENIATVQHGATAMVLRLFGGNTDVNKNLQHNIDGESCIVIRLGKPHHLNHIRMMLYDADDERYYSYYIEASLNQTKWHRIVDYSKYACRSVQNLYFDEEVAQYLKIVGTSNSKGSDFHLVLFETFYKSEVPQTANGVIRPERNVAISENKTIILKEEKCYPVLDENYEDIACHEIQENSSGLIVQLSQPYLVSSMQLLLDRKDHDMYKYFIETSINKTDWELVIDRRNVECKSWQDLQFAERIVIFIKITGTYSLKKKENFYCDHFECPSEEKKIE